mmetsp:Transcript_15814/g.22502  ORF Transcript_15814/g.22502 Transcript_15814/m.22502 type:complete len:198 (+) Transcript_15814:760-1353(+)
MQMEQLKQQTILSNQIDLQSKAALLRRQFQTYNQKPNTNATSNSALPQCEQAHPNEKKKSKAAQGMTVTNATSTAGIGTRKRDSIERSKMLEGHLPSSSLEETCSLYISGLPTPSSSSSSNCANFKEEENKLKADLTKFLEQLFQPYGSPLKVTLYMDKISMKMKGDGLITYNFQRKNKHDTNEISNFLDSVSSQVR